MTGKSDHENKGLIHLVLDGMPAWIRAIVFSFLAFPLIIAVSGMMLQVNVGSTIERVIDAQFQKQGQEQIEAQRKQLEQMLAPVLESIATLSDATEELKTNVGTIEERLTSVEKDAKETKEWACSHSDIQSLKDDRPNFCN